jgi:hypothetical protein
LVRHPVGGHSWHHLQYLIGLQRLGHEVVFFEHFGWENSCYDPAQDILTGDPSYGISYVRSLLEPHGLADKWCYLAEDGAEHGWTRKALARFCADCDLYLNLSNINWIPELEQCRRRVLVDTDPVFSQIGGFGLGGPFSRYHALFTYGQNVHQPGCEMPTGGAQWQPTRQPVVLDLWPVSEPNPSSPFTTVINWSSFGDKEFRRRVYGQKDRQFEPFFSLPNETGQPMEIAVKVPEPVRARLLAGGWRVRDPREVTRDPYSYQQFLTQSRAEFSVAKHGYVSTQCGWFSDRSSAYLAMGRPVIVEETGFSRVLPTGEGLLSFTDPEEAREGIWRVNADYAHHCRKARAVAEEYFDATKVLTELLNGAMRT